MRRILAVLLSLALLWGPSSSWASVVQSAAVPSAGTPVQPLALTAPGAVVSAASLFSPPSLRFGGSTLGLPASPRLELPESPAVQTVVPVSAVRPVAAVETAIRRDAPKEQASAASVRERVTELRSAQQEDAVSLKTAGAESSSAIAEQGFARILGIETPAATGAMADAPEVHASPRARWLSLSRLVEASSEAGVSVPVPGLRTFLTGTAVFKIGQDALAIGVPLLALTAFGSASWAAVFAAALTLAQAVASSLAGGMVDRGSPIKVL